MSIKWAHRHSFALSFRSYPLLQSYRFAINVFLIRTSHPSGSRLLYYCISPWSISEPQKTIGSMPCPIVMSQILWLLTNPVKAHDIGESDRINQNSTAIFVVDAAASNQVLWILTNPHTGSLLQPFLLSKQFLLIKWHPITHDII